MSAPVGNKDNTLLVFPFVEYVNTEAEKAAAMRLIASQRDPETIAMVLGLIPVPAKPKPEKGLPAHKPKPDSGAQNPWCETHKRDKTYYPYKSGTPRWICYNCRNDKRLKIGRYRKVDPVCSIHGTPNVPKTSNGRPNGWFCRACRNEYARNKYVRKVEDV